MRKTRFTEEQIVHALCRWERKFAGMGIAEMHRLKQVKEENRKLKNLVADLSLDKQMLQDVLAKKV